MSGLTTQSVDTASEIHSESQISQNELIKYMNNFVTLSEIEAIQLLDTLITKNFKKGDFLIKEGQIKQLCCFVLKGCLREYYIVDGEEKTTQFYTEGQPVIPHEGSASMTPSKLYITFVEDSVAIVGSKIDDKEFKIEFPRINDMSDKSMEKEWASSQEHFANFIIKSPEERYLYLVQTLPDLIDRVPQYHLASYLGIKPESLSRIRKRIMNK